MQVFCGLRRYRHKGQPGDGDVRGEKADVPEGSVLFHKEAEAEESKEARSKSCQTRYTIHTIRCIVYIVYMYYCLILTVLMYLTQVRKAGILNQTDFYNA